MLSILYRPIFSLWRYCPDDTMLPNLPLRLGIQILKMLFLLCTVQNNLLPEDISEAMVSAGDDPTLFRKDILSDSGIDVSVSIVDYIIEMVVEKILLFPSTKQKLYTSSNKNVFFYMVDSRKYCIPMSGQLLSLFPKYCSRSL